MQSGSELQSPLKEIRAAFGLTQAELARLAGISSTSVISEMETGVRPISGKVEEVLKSAHVDVAEIGKRQEAFMRQREEEMQRKLEQVAAEGK